MTPEVYDMYFMRIKFKDCIIKIQEYIEDADGYKNLCLKFIHIFACSIHAFTKHIEGEIRGNSPPPNSNFCPLILANYTGI